MFTSKPFDSLDMNLLASCNELFCLLVSYQLLNLLDLQYGPEEQWNMGEVISILFYIAAIFNGTVIILLSLKGLIQKVRSLFVRRCSSRNEKTKKAPV